MELVRSVLRAASPCSLVERGWSVVRSVSQACPSSPVDSARSVVRSICPCSPVDSVRSVVRSIAPSCPVDVGRRSVLALVLLLFLALSYFLLLSNSGGAALERFFLPQFKKAWTQSNAPWTDPGPYHVAYPRGYHFIMDDTSVCRASKPFVLLMVPVAPSQVDTRNLIRGSWGRSVEVEGHLLQTLFFVGVARPGGGAEHLQEKLRQENEAHHDLIQSDFTDSYHNLTIKTMMMIEWLTAYCSDAATFAVKVDSDMFLHVPNLFAHLLRPETPRVGYMTGLVWWKSPVIRNPMDRFYMPPWVIAQDTYPPYPLGMIYILSLDLPRQLLRASQEIRPIYIEDAYLGMCLQRLQLKPTDPPRIDQFLVEPIHPLSPCALSVVIGTVTDSKARMMSYWIRSQDPNTHC